MLGGNRETGPRARAGAKQRRVIRGGPPRRRGWCRRRGGTRPNAGARGAANGRRRPGASAKARGADAALSVQTGAPGGQARAYVRTLGGFELFADGRAVLFSSAKAREMLALLVDRGGGFMTYEELIARLWPDEPVNALTLARCRKIAMRLKNALREHGIEDIVEAAKGRRRIAAERVEFDFMRADELGAPAGDYMKGYAWAQASPTALRLRGEPGGAE